MTPRLGTNKICICKDSYLKLASKNLRFFLEGAVTILFTKIFFLEPPVSIPRRHIKNVVDKTFLISAFILIITYKRSHLFLNG